MIPQTDRPRSIRARLTHRSSRELVFLLLALRDGRIATAAWHAAGLPAPVLIKRELRRREQGAA